jgi:tripartite-type tricarboxylate transporter receptor subunit TctC
VKPTTRRQFLSLSGAAATAPVLAPLLARTASAQASAPAWPTKPIRIIVPLTPGSASDVMARIVADQLAAQLGQPIIVENRPGAGNTIGMSAVAKAEPDGYTILVNSSTHTVTPATRSNLGFEMTDLAAVIPLGNMPVVMIFNPSKGYKKLGDFVAYAKANPGKINYTSAGAGNSSHLNGERFRLAAGIEAVHLPFKGAPEATTEVIAGRADFYFSPLVNALSLIKEGTVQALAVSGSARASALPDVPTTVEAGYPNSEYNFWVGMFAPAKTPADIRTRLYTESAKALQSPATRDRLAGLGADPMPLNSAQFEALVKTEIETNTQLVKAAGIKVN